MLNTNRVNSDIGIVQIRFSPISKATYRTKNSKDERRANAPSYPEYKVCWSIPAIDLSVSSMQDIFKTGLSLYHCEARSALPGYQKANELTTVS